MQSHELRRGLRYLLLGDAMKRLMLGALAGAFFVASAGAQQTAGKRDSTVADSLTRLRPWLNGWRSQTLDRAISTLRVPHPAARVDTVRVRDTITVHDTIRVERADSVVVTDSVIVPPPPPPPDTTTIVRAELPRVAPSLTVPAPTRVTRVLATADLQAALSAAQPGDELRLALGGRWTGNFLIPPRCGTGWITVRADIDDSLLPAGVRVDTTKAKALRLPQIVTTNSAPALSWQGAGCRLRLLGLHIRAETPAATLNYGIVWLGGGKDDGQTTVAAMPREAVVDRVVITALPTTETSRCLLLNSGAAAVTNSTMLECHRSQGDAQAILGYNGTGPYLIENNHLEGSGENIMFGGADPDIVNLVPSDITVRRNLIRKPLAWKGRWSIKNGFELKNARRVLFEANVLDPCSWQGSQSGMCLVIKSSGDVNGANAQWQGTQDVTIRWNLMRSMHRGIDLQAVDCSGQPCVAVHTARVTVEDNLFDQVGVSNSIPALSGWLVLLSGDLKNILMQRNTFVGNAPGYGFSLSMAAPQSAIQNLRVLSNIFGGQVGADANTEGYTMREDATGKTGKNALTYVAATSWTFSGNVVSRVTPEWVAAQPVGNVYLDAISKIGLRADGSSANYGSVGVSIPTLLSKTAGVVP